MATSNTNADVAKNFDDLCEIGQARIIMRGGFEYFLCFKARKIYYQSIKFRLKIRTAARQRAREMILAKRTEVARLAQYLFENERISGSQFVELIMGNV